MISTRSDTRSFRLLEGELIVFQGIGWIVKGFQHSEDYLLAYPRYDLYNKRKLSHHEATRIADRFSRWWDCLKLNAPGIPLLGSYKFHRSLYPFKVRKVISELSILLELDADRIEATGSSVVRENGAWDIDVIIYGADESTAERIRDLVDRGVLKQPSLYFFIEEYLDKHKGKIDLETYILSKSRTILSFILNGELVNIRLYRYEKGSRSCIEEVEERKPFAGTVVLDNSIDPILPSKRMAKIGGEEVYFETSRELYAEIPGGRYYVIGDIEVRNGRLYLVADRGLVRRIEG
ncbi:hypothetical protein ACSU1N_04860 [Thermogladius sp. 4427co]|uniref:hypothetical protein n=1 Tax=Thermogladius sp. 4427co TaxID=3450718 RepID=UPI003F7A837B